MLALLAALTIKKIAPTLDWRLSGLEHWDQGAVLVCWHGEIMLGAALLVHLGRTSECWTPIVPEYGQSGLMTEFAHQLGLQPIHVPGYERPDERQAALERLIPRLQAGQSVFLAADGHRAPAHVVRHDPLWLAARAGVPLLPVALAARPALTLPTWDRKVIPLLRSRVAAMVGEPMGKDVTTQMVRQRLEGLKNKALLT